MHSTPIARRVEQHAREAGVVGAGGGGFPTYAKWTDGAAGNLLVNHQESEPNCGTDRWLGREFAPELAARFRAVARRPARPGCRRRVKRDRDLLAPLVRATGATVYGPGVLPLDPADGAGEVVVVLTDDTYEYGTESLLLQVVADTVIGRDPPTDHGWVVQNTETLCNLLRALDGKPTLDTWLHVDGVCDGQRLPNRMYRAPVGTPARTLFEAAGVDRPFGDDVVVVDGGPGWGFAASDPVVTKATNCLLALDRRTVAEHRYENGRVDVRGLTDWSASVARGPTRVEPDRVRVPVQTTDRFDGATRPEPTVTPGETIDRGDRIAAPTAGLSVAQHAPLDGTVTAVDERIEIQAE